MDAVDGSKSGPNSTSERPEIAQGRMEVERGFAKMRGEVPKEPFQSNVGSFGGTSYLTTIVSLKADRNPPKVLTCLV